MKSPRVSPLAQIEWTIGDLDSAHELLAGLFDAAPIEKEFSAALSGPHMEILHLGLGKTVLQLCKPLIDATGHWDALQKKGAHVYNLTFFVDDLALILERCAGAGVELEWHFPLREIYERVVPEENLAGSLEAAMIATADLIGFNLEIAETFWAREPDPRLLFPAYHPDWPDMGDRIDALELVNVETTNIGTALGTLEAIFGDSLVIHLPESPNDAENCREALVELGLIRIHYIQKDEPRRSVDGGPQCRVESLALPALDVEEITSIARARDIVVEPAPAILFEPLAENDGGARLLRASHLVGIDFVVR